MSMDLTKPEVRALKLAVHLLGGTEKVSKLMNVKRNSIHYWMHAGIPIHYALVLEKTVRENTDIILTRKHFRPDIFGKPEPSESFPDMHKEY